MRGNSGLLRWLASYCSATNRTLLIFLLVAMAFTHAGPLSTRHRRMIREIYSEFDQAQNITQAAEGTCLHHGTPVPETSLQCEKKAGCRAIQKTGYCCPDYQCHCERDGKIYANGEKLVDPETPCKGCYCQGGEILCNSVNCYIRNDCEPKYIAGRCCPEYDNCPPIESGHLTKEASTTTEQNQSSRNASDDSNESSSPSTIPKQEAAANNPLGIKIKEITKAEEIRIIDEKPKTTYQLIKPFESASSNQQPKPTKAAELIEENATVILKTGQGENNQLGDFLEPENKLDSATTTTAEPVNKLESADANSITDEDAVKTVRHTETLELEDSLDLNMTTSTETAVPEVPEEVGKEVVIVDSNGQTKPITVFGVEGLQRGDVLDEVSEYEEKKSSAKRSESNGHTMEPATTELPYDTSIGPEIIYENTSAGAHPGTDVKTVSDVDPVASSSDDFISILATTKLSDPAAIDSTTESVTGSNNAYDTVFYTSSPDRLALEDNISNSSGFENASFAYESNDNVTISTEGPPIPAVSTHHHHHSLMDDDENTSSEPNPAYPSINDDLSIYGTKVMNSEEDSQLKEEKLLHDVLIHKSNYTQEQNLSTIVPSDWLKTTEGVLIDNVSELNPEEPSPILIPDWEHNSTESAAVLNSTAQDTMEDPDSVRNYFIEDSSVESGEGPISTRDREHTTPNTSKIVLEIDEDGSGRVEHDPKEDSESVKYHEESEASVGFPKPALDSGIQTIISAAHGFHKSYLMDILTFN